MFRKCYSDIKILESDRLSLNDETLSIIISQYEETHSLRFSKEMVQVIKRFVNMFKTQKGICLTGPVCSGKSTILRVASQVFKNVFNKTLKYSIINPKNFVNQTPLEV